MTARRRTGVCCSGSGSTFLIEGDDILGDGVNIAARLEGIAEPGG
jgi:class 3 adenylate cyclase